MSTWYVEISKPAFPFKGEMLKVFRMDEWNGDVLSPTLSHLFRVRNAKNKQDALIAVITGKAFTMISPKGQQLGYIAEQPPMIRQVCRNTLNMAGA